MHVKPITDARALSALHAKGFDKAWDSDDFQTHIDNPLDDVLGLERDGALAGFILVRTAGDQSEIITITVDPKQRQTGLATQLLSAAEIAITARGSDIIFLDVAADNEGAIALYRKHGYVQHGTRPGYYKRENGRATALLFQKHLRA